ncbi:hypothetical protein Rs2_50043 [Raphanus sativus]|uniref:Uncharacterized protein LOC108811921 n=1 Tax=Raphanus sativus TaxID=3726 RepID=A0A6J0JRC0_RAPSA|nr:uncharacterized protein LOC108811921 [Raphanus sativus]KAJ4868405.1 hypothetical protein Rs2_50043 [Raphanus sativus]
MHMSNGTVAIATAMVFSSTALFLVTARQFYGNQTSKVHDQTPPRVLRSCLSSSEAMKKQRSKKKKVRFAENVRDTKGNGNEYRRRMTMSGRNVPEPVTKPGKTGSICGISTMPANRMALYHGILRDRDHRTQCSY